MANILNPLYIEDLNGSDVRLDEGQYPLVIQYNGRPWVLDSPTFSDEGAAECYTYVPLRDFDLPHILRVWN